LAVSGATVRQSPGTEAPLSLGGLLPRLISTNDDRLAVADRRARRTDKIGFMIFDLVHWRTCLELPAEMPRIPVSKARESDSDTDLQDINAK